MDPDLDQFIYIPRIDQLYQSCLLHASTNAYITSFKRLLRISNTRIMIQSWPICEMQSYLEYLILSLVLLKVFFNMSSYQLSPSCARGRSSMVVPKAIPANFSALSFNTGTLKRSLVMLDIEVFV